MFLGLIFIKKMRELLEKEGRSDIAIKAGALNKSRIGVKEDGFIFHEQSLKFIKPGF